jgi:hypothetical protein
MNVYTSWYKRACSLFAGSSRVFLMTAEKINKTADTARIGSTLMSPLISEELQLFL